MAAAPQCTAIIADDHSLVRNALRTVLDQIDGLSVVAEAANGLEAIAAAKAHKPSLLLLDHAMPYAHGVEVFAEVRRWSPETRIIVLTGLTAAGLLREFVDAGVDGLFLKRGDEQDLVRAIPDVLAGTRRIAPEIEQIIAMAGPAQSLTRREMQILDRIARGETNAEIAEVLNISPKTVDNHRTNIMRKLEVHSVAELLAYALREGLLEPAKHT